MAAAHNPGPEQMQLFSGFPVRLEVFEGPLDLLLHLVRRQEVEIAEVRIAAITDEYLRTLEAMTAINMEVAGEFVVMAANLLWLKSRELLPRQEDPAAEALGAEEEEFIETEEELKRRLEEYRAYKEAAGLLAEAKELRQRVFLRSLSDEDDFGSGLLPLADVSVFDMLEALQEMLERTRETPPAVVVAPELTIPDCIDDILLRLHAAPQRRCRFVDLVDLPTTRLLVVMVFLATLELIRRRRIQVSTGPEVRELWVRLAE